MRQKTFTGDIVIFDKTALDIPTFSTKTFQLSQSPRDFLIFSPSTPAAMFSLLLLRMKFQHCSLKRL